jgi:hypothetical protein
MDYEVRKTEDGGIQVKNGGPRFTMPFVWGGKFYASAKAVAEEAGTRPNAAHDSITKGCKLKGKEIRKATRADIPKGKSKAADVPGYRLDADGTVRVKDGNGKWVRAYVGPKGVEVGGHPKGRTPAVAADMGDSVRVYASKAARKKKEGLPFAGVVWPSGQVEVRLGAGGSWHTTYASKKDVPKEIGDFCTWLS